MKVHRVLPSGSMVPRIRGWLNSTEIRLATARKTTLYTDVSSLDSIANRLRSTFKDQGEIKELVSSFIFTSLVSGCYYGGCKVQLEFQTSREMKLLRPSSYTTSGSLVTATELQWKWDIQTQFDQMISNVQSSGIFEFHLEIHNYSPSLDDYIHTARHLLTF